MLIVRAAVGLIRAIFRLYAWIVIGLLLLMAISYVFAPVAVLLHQLPPMVREAGLQLIWLSMVAIVAGWLVDDFLPLGAAPTPPIPDDSPLQLTDQAPWLEGETIADGEVEGVVPSTQLRLPNARL